MEIPKIPNKYYPAMTTICLCLIVLSIVIYSFPKDPFMWFISGLLFGAGLVGLLITIHRWTKEYFSKKK